MVISYKDLATIIYTIVQIEDADLDQTEDLIEYLGQSESGSITITIVADDEDEDEER